MRLYPELPGPRSATLARDLVAVVVLAVLASVALAVHEAVDQLAVLGEGVRTVGEKVPVVGGPVEDLGRAGEDRVHRLANLLGAIVFGIPAALVLWMYLPKRVAQIRRLTAAERALADHASPERRRLVAMRAAFSLPYGQLLAYTRDPLGDLAAERYDALVAAALEDAGLRPR